MTKQDENFFRETIHGISDGLFVLDDQLVVQFFNETAGKILQKRSEDVVGKYLFESFPEAVGSEFEVRYRKAIRTREFDKFEAYYSAELQANWYEVRIHPLEKGIAVFFQVITEQKKSETALIESEKKYKAIVDYAPVGIYRSNVYGKFLFVNERLAEILGYESVDELEKINLNEIYYERGERDKLIEKYDVKNKHHVKNLEVRWKKKNGEQIWIALTSHAIKNNDGSTKYYEGFVTDISERKQADIALKESEEKFRTFMDHLPLGVFIKNADGRYEFLNKYNEQNFGGNDWKGKTAYDYFNESTADNFTYEDRRVLNKGAFVSTYSAKNRIGEDRHFRTHYFPIVRPNGEKLVGGISRDITEEVMVSKALQESEENFRSIYENAPLAFIMWDDETKVIAWNEMAEIIFGYTEEEVLGKSFFDLIVEPEHKLLVKEIVDNLKNDIVQNNIQNKNITKDGKIIWCQWNNSVLHDASGNIAAFLSTAMDITEKIGLQQKLEENERKLSTLLDNLPGMAYRCLEDEFWTMEFVSDGCKKITGYEPEELINNKLISYADLIIPEDQYHVEKSIKKFDGYYQAFDIEYRIKTKDGSIKWVWERGVRVSENYLEGIIEDITKRKTAESKLRESEEQKRLVLEGSMDAILLTSPDGSIYSANPAACKMLQRSEEEICEIGRNGLVDLSDPRLKKLLTERKQKGRAQGEVRMIRKDGTYFPAEISSSVFIDSNGRLKTSMIIRDISGRKKAEQALKESEEKFRNLVETMNEGLAIFDPNFNITYVNDSFANLLEYNVGELIGMNAVNLHDESEKTKLLEQLEKRKRGISEPYKIFYTTKSGKKIFSKISPKALVDNKGNFSGSFSIVTDLTEIQNAYLKLEKSEEKLRAFFDSDVVGTIYGDIYGGIHRANNKYLEIIGYSREEVESGKVKWDQITPSEFRELEIEKVKEAQKYGLCTPYEKQYIRKDGTRIWVIVGYVLVGEKKEEFVAFILDINDRKRVEEKLRKSEEKFRHIFENVQVGIYRTRVSDGKLIMANQKMAEMFGYKTIKTAEQYYVTSKHYVDKNARAEMLKLIKEKGRFDNYEAALTTRTGEVKWYQYSGRLYEEEGYIEGVATDITERKRFETELKNRNEFIQTVLDNLPIGIALNRINEGVAFYHNKKFEEVYGWPADELKDVSTFFNKVYPDEEYRKKMLGRIMKDIRSGDPSKMHWESIEVTHKDGTQHIVAAQNIPMFEQNTMVSTVWDVTEQKEAENSLKESEIKYRSLIENSPFAVFIMRGRKIVYTNPAAEKITGYSVNEVLSLDGERLNKILYEDDRDYVWNKLGDFTKHPKDTSELEFRIVNKGGKVIWLGASMTAIYYEKKPSIQAIVYDTTEQKLAAQRIEMEKNKAQNYLEAASIMMLALNTDGVVTMINSKGAEILGYSKKYIIGKNWFDHFLLTDEVQKVKKIFNGLMTGKNNFHTHEINRVKCRYNKIKTIGWSNNLLKNSEGEIIGTLSSGEDITERIKLQRDLETSYKELERLTNHLQKIREEERTNLARELHDDLGQSLTALKLDLSQIKKNIKSDDSKVNSKVDSAFNLVSESVRTVQKITSELRPGMIDDLGLIPTIRWYVGEFEERSEMEVNLRIKLKEEDIKDDLKISLYRIIQESLTNVARHSHASKVIINFKRIQNNIQLEVIDNGIGIDEDEVHKPDSFGMIGMKERIQLIGGSFEVSGERGKGTTIKVTIPLG